MSELSYTAIASMNARLVPRSPGRIAPIVAALEEVWREFPDMRLGQLIVNAVREREVDLFNVEDDTLVYLLGFFSGKHRVSQLTPSKPPKGPKPEDSA